MASLSYYTEFCLYSTMDFEFFTENIITGHTTTAVSSGHFSHWVTQCYHARGIHVQMNANHYIACIRK